MLLRFNHWQLRKIYKSPFSNSVFQNRGVYMFRIDNDHVIDATLTGGPARWVALERSLTSFWGVIRVPRPGAVREGLKFLVFSMIFILWAGTFSLQTVPLN